MNNRFTSYMRLGASVIIGLIFGYASFFLISNYYHYQELKTSIDGRIGDRIVYQNVNQKLEALQNNLNFVIYRDNDKITVNFAQTLKGHLSICQREISSDFKNYADLDKITYKVVDDMRSKYIGNVVNECAINQLYYLISYDTSTLPANSSLKAIQPFIKEGIDQLKDRNNYLANNYLDNSSITFRTITARNTVHNPVADGFDEVLTSYNNAIDFYLEISNWLRNEAGV